jgi:very-short-patch-repair endonuclease
MANETARKLRKTMTPQEVRLWQRLRALKRNGHHFRRQAPIENYIVDFACYSARLIIELDGSQHAAAGHARRDAARDAALTAAGFHVLRIWNNDIDRNMEDVMQAILVALGES